MTPQTTLEAVRELSERAMLRPAPLRLRLTRPACGKRAEYCYCDVGPKKDFLQLALEKTETATEWRPVVLPPAA